MPTRFNGNLYDNDSDLLYKNRSVLTTLGLGTVVYVSASGGDNPTGAVGRIDRPFKTIQAAFNACTDGFGQYHVLILPGTYNESASTPSTFQRGTIEYLPGAHHFYNGNDALYTLIVNAEQLLVRGTDKLKAAISRTGTNTGGAIDFATQYYGNAAHLKNLFINSTGTGAAVKKAIYTEDCYIKSTGGLACSHTTIPYYKNCVVISTVSNGIYIPNNSPYFDHCYVKANGYAVLQGNGAGIFATGSTFISETTDAYYGNNQNSGSRIENCFFKGYTISARIDTYNYGDLKPHIIRNSVFQVTDAAAVNPAKTWFGIIQNVICNKPMLNNSPFSENDIVLTDVPINVDVHGYGAVEIYPTNYFTT